MTPIESTKRWLETMVVGHNLCPFARSPYRANRIRYALTCASTELELLLALQAEIKQLADNKSIDTTLLIHPGVLEDFYDYNQFLNVVDNYLREEKLEGIYQVASFHPNYQFSGTQPEDAENYSNRSPYPLLHLLRENQVSAAIDGHPNTGDIPTRNIQTLTSIGCPALEQQWQACFQPASSC